MAGQYWAPIAGPPNHVRFQRYFNILRRVCQDDGCKFPQRKTCTVYDAGRRKPLPAGRGQRGRGSSQAPERGGRRRRDRDSGQGDGAGGCGTGVGRKPGTHCPEDGEDQRQPGGREDPDQPPCRTAELPERRQRGLGPGPRLCAGHGPAGDGRQRQEKRRAVEGLPRPAQDEHEPGKRQQGLQRGAVQVRQLGRGPEGAGKARREPDADEKGRGEPVGRRLYQAAGHWRGIVPHRNAQQRRRRAGSHGGGTRCDQAHDGERL